MEPHIYDELIKQEKKHWWFIARRAITYTLLRGITMAPSPLILDAGCGSGGNLKMLSTFGDVFAMEIHPQVLEIAQRRKIGHVEYGQLPDQIPFPEVNFDLVTLFDVLEHLDDDLAALQALHERMNPEAVLCLTVPAHQWLFSRLDTEHHHRRRYSKKRLRALLLEAGFRIHCINYWNCLLFPAAIIVRILEKLQPNRDYTIGSRIPKPWLNDLLKKTVSAEHSIIPHVPLPFGLSIVALARKA